MIDVSWPRRPPSAPRTARPPAKVARRALALAFAGMMRLDRGAPRSGGALLGAAWWVRPEAAVLAPLAVMLAPLSRRARVVALAAALVVALPYTLVLRVEQGYWSLTPKTALVHAPAWDRADCEDFLLHEARLPDDIAPSKLAGGR